MGIKNNLQSFKSKKELIEELNYYKSLIIKKVKNGDYYSALEKVRSALVLLEEYRDNFNIKKELIEFYELSKKVVSELSNHRRIYERRFKNLLRERLNEANLENFSKLLAMLKNEVDDNLTKYNLHDLRDNIITYFTLIKKIYTIISSYKVLNYNDASVKILKFVKEFKVENYPNLKDLISSIIKKQVMRGAKLITNIHTLSDLEEGDIPIESIEIISILKNANEYKKVRQIVNIVI